MKKFKRVVVISDLHCGHYIGLTPPSYRKKEGGIYDNFILFEKEIWNFYVEEIKKLQPIDLLIVNGDAIDGKGERSGSTELIEADVTRQAEMAIECIKQVKAKNMLMLYGTPYHTGKDSDYENIIANHFNCSIKGHEWIDVNGVIFDFKHSVGSSSIPHSRATSINREKLWNQIWSLDERQPNADIIVRSHVHYFNYAGNSDYLAMTTPALSGYGSKFGVRKCSGLVDIGFVHFDINKKGDYTWEPHILKADFLKSKPIKI